MDLKVEVNSKFVQGNDTFLLGRDAKGKPLYGMVTPPLDADYWIAQVMIGKEQAVVCFPKFGTIGVGCKIEKNDWNTNFPYTCTALEIFNHIRKNAPSVKKEKFLAAIELLQKFINEHLVKPA